MMLKSKSNLALGLTAGIAVQGLSHTALAQEGGDISHIEEILVTARKVGESLQEAPMSITAFTGDMLKDKGLENLTDIARSTAGFSFENFNGAFPQPTIRGQSQSSLINPVQNVSTFYNGVYLPRQYMIDSSLLNIAQVEVLKGPQSAALGRNAFAGAITFTTKKPGDELEFDIEVAAGEDEYQKLKAGISGPILPGLVSGIAGISAEEWDGSWENNHPLADASGARTKGNLGGFDTDSYMLGLSITPAENVSIEATYLDSEKDLDSPAQWAVAGNQGNYATNALNCGAIGSLGGPSLWCGELPTDPVFAEGDVRPFPGLVTDPRGGVTLSSEVISLAGEFNLTEQFAINYLYGATKGSFEGASSSVPNQVVGYDGVALNPNFSAPGTLLFDTTGNGSIESDSHEVRFTFTGDSLTAFGGASFSTSDDLTDFALVTVPAQTEGPLVPGVAITDEVFASSSAFGLSGRALDAREITSVFGLVVYEFDKFKVSAEARYSEEDITNTNRITELSRETQFDYFTPRLTGTYSITKSNRIYASYAAGTKAGGFNSFFIDPTQAEYEAENNTTIEIGSRNELANGSITLNGTLFWIDAEDLQVLEPRIGANGTVLGNRSAAETLGAEAELQWAVSSGFNLYTSIAYVDATFDDGVIDPSSAARCDDIVCSTAGDIGGNRLSRSPQFTFNAGFAYEGNLSQDLGYFVNANVGYQDKQYVTSLNVTEIPERTIVDAAFGARWNDFEAKLSADNLFDEQYVSSAFSVDFLQTYTANLGDRRRITLTLSYQY